MGIPNSKVCLKGKSSIVALYLFFLIFQDYLVMIPEEYYKATHLRQRVEKPCLVDSTADFCVDYKYLSVAFPGAINVPTELGQLISNSRTLLPYAPFKSFSVLSPGVRDCAMTILCTRLHLPCRKREYLPRISHFPFENRETCINYFYRGRSIDCCFYGGTKQSVRKISKLKLEQEKVNYALLSLRKSLKDFFALFVACLMTGALYRTVPASNPCMLCGLDY